MSYLSRGLILVLALFAAACSFYSFPSKQLIVSASSEVADDGRKSYLLEHHRVPEYLDQYIHEWAEEYQPRTTLRIETIITDVEIGAGKDFVAVQTTVSEGGEVLGRFDNRRDTSRSRAVKRITNALARDIMSEVSRL